MDYLTSLPEELIALERGNINLHNIKGTGANES